MSPSEIGLALLYGASLTFWIIMSVQAIFSWKYLAAGQKFFLAGVAGLQWIAVREVRGDGLDTSSLVVLALVNLSFLCYMLEPKRLTKKRRGKTILVHKKDVR